MYNPPWFAHLGNLLPSTKITFLVELRRPRDPLGVANTQDATLGILERVWESFHNSNLNTHSTFLLMHPKAPFYSGGTSNKQPRRGTTSTYMFISMGDHKVEVKKLKSAFFFMSATFQNTSFNFNQQYLLGLLAKLAARGLVGKLWKSYFRDLMWHAIWSSRLRDMRQKVQLYTNWDSFCCS